MQPELSAKRNIHLFKVDKQIQLSKRSKKTDEYDPVDADGIEIEDDKVVFSYEGEPLLTVLHKKQTLGVRRLEKDLFFYIARFSTKSIKRKLGQLKIHTRSIEEAKTWLKYIQQWLWERDSECEEGNTWKHFYILINPFSGVKKAMQTFKNLVEPVLWASNITYEISVTKYSKHAEELIFKADLTKYDAIMTLSGDGIINEVLNGLIKRKDVARAIRTPLAAINCGTGNSLVAEILHKRGELSIENSTVNSLCAAIKGAPRALYLLQYQTCCGTSLYGFLFIQWGLLADVEFDSSTLRILGSFRYKLYTLKHCLKNKVHYVKLRYRPPPSQMIPTCYKDYLCRTNAFEALDPNLPDPSNYSNQDWIDIPNNECVFGCVINTGWWGLDLVACPFSTTADDILYLMLIRPPITRVELMKLFLKIGQDEYIMNEKVEIYCCQEVEISPDVLACGPSSFMSVDGEELPLQDLHITNGRKCAWVFN